jgi:hypothetical protein
MIAVGSNSDSLKLFRTSEKTTMIDLRPDDAYAMIKLKNGGIMKQELYYGHSYLSQGGRSMQVPSDARSVIIYTYKGSNRTLQF